MTLEELIDYAKEQQLQWDGDFRPHKIQLHIYIDGESECKSVESVTFDGNGSTNQDAPHVLDIHPGEFPE